MSVTTEADKKIASAKEHLHLAVNDLLTVINPDTWGTIDLVEDYIKDVQTVAIKLIKLNRKL